MSTRRMGLVLVSAVVLLPTLAGASDAGPRRRAKAGAPGLSLAWVDVSGLARGVEGIARWEVRSILDRAGVETLWRRASPEEEGRPGEVRIVLVDRLLARRGSRSLVLGSIPEGPRSHPLVWIHLRSIQATLRLRPGSAAGDLSPGARRDLGVALGRVIVHEIVHALAPTVGHGQGLMSRRLGRGSLTGTRPFVEPGAIRGVRLALRARGRARSAGPEVLDARGPSPAASPPCVNDEAGGAACRPPSRGLAR